MESVSNACFSTPSLNMPSTFKARSAVMVSNLWQVDGSLEMAVSHKCCAYGEPRKAGGNMWQRGKSCFCRNKKWYLGYSPDGAWVERLKDLSNNPFGNASSSLHSFCVIVHVNKQDHKRSRQDNRDHFTEWVYCCKGNTRGTQSNKGVLPGSEDKSTSWWGWCLIAKCERVTLVDVGFVFFSHEIPGKHT